MRSISQRELRNESGRVMRDVARGETFEVTSRGRPVAVLIGVDRGVDDMVLRHGPDTVSFPPRVRRDETSDDVLAELRTDR